MIPCLIDLKTNEAFRLTGLSRVQFPDGTVAFAVRPGHVHPPQYEGEDGPPPAFRVLEAVIDEQGAGPKSSDGPPVFDPETGIVTIVRTRSPAPPDTRPEPPSIPRGATVASAHDRIDELVALLQAAGLTK